MTSTAAIDRLIASYERLAAAIYLAALVSDEKLNAALSDFWVAADTVYTQMRDVQTSDGVGIAHFITALKKLEKTSEIARRELGLASSRLEHRRSRFFSLVRVERTPSAGT